MKLQQHFLAEQFGPVKEDLMVFKIIDILYLEGRHAYFPDDFAGGGPELDIMRRYQSAGQIGVLMLLRYKLMGKIQVVLVDKTPIKTLSLLVERTVAIIGHDPILNRWFHSTNRY